MKDKMMDGRSGIGVLIYTRPTFALHIGICDSGGRRVGGGGGGVEELLIRQMSPSPLE